MNVSVKTYMSSIIDVLIKTVLPSVKSNFARTQLSFAIDMLNQLQNHVEYRSDVMKDDCTAAREMRDVICTALRENDIEVPGEIVSSETTASSSEAGMADLEEALTQLEAASSAAVDVMYEKREQIKDFSALEKKILDLSNQWIQRRAGLKAPTVNLESLESQ
jgi:hypothetical protein